MARKLTRKEQRMTKAGLKKYQKRGKIARIYSPVWEYKNPTGEYVKRVGQGIVAAGVGAGVGMLAFGPGRRLGAKLIGKIVKARKLVSIRKYRKMSVMGRALKRQSTLGRAMKRPQYPGF